MNTSPGKLQRHDRFGRSFRAADTSVTGSGARLYPEKRGPRTCKSLRSSVTISTYVESAYAPIPRAGRVYAFAQLCQIETNRIRENPTLPTLPQTYWHHNSRGSQRHPASRARWPTRAQPVTTPSHPRVTPRGGFSPPSDASRTAFARRL